MRVIGIVAIAATAAFGVAGCGDDSEYLLGADDPDLAQGEIDRLIDAAEECSESDLDLEDE